MNDKLFVFLMAMLFVGSVLYLTINESARIDYSSRIEALENHTHAEFNHIHAESNVRFTGEAILLNGS